MEQDKINQYIDTQKTVFDYIKYITTLNTGAIVLLSSFLEKLFKDAVWKLLVLVVFSGFMLSVGLLTLCGFAIIRSIRTPEKISPKLVRFTTWTFLLGMSLFLIALLSLSVFTIRNLI